MRRRLKLSEPDEELLTHAMSAIDEIYGVDQILFDAGKLQLSISYDASRICLECVEEVLSKYKIQIDKGWWNRFKEEYYLFVDENIKANSQHVPFSCHKVPPHK